jgi:hypothetical protein
VCVLAASVACGAGDDATTADEDLAGDAFCKAGSFGKEACHRMTVQLTSPIGSLSDESGAPGIAEAKVWYVSACTPEVCTLFRVSGNTRPFRLVNRKDLLAHSAPTHAGHTNVEAVQSREAWALPVGAPSYPYVSAFAWTQLADVPDAGDAALVPPSGGCPGGVASCGTNQDVSGRGTVMWSVDQPAGYEDFRGYVAFPSFTDSVVLASEQRETVRWVNRSGADAGFATFCMVWQRVGNYWVWVSMLERVDANDGRAYVTLRR